jgi:UDP-N-acetyl-D-mannosaminuronic acid dehydrogenase
MRISVIDLGYIGLPTACLLADAGHVVSGFDVDQKKLQLITEGKAPFDEKGLQVLLKRVVVGGKFTVSEVLTQADVYLVAVPTPDVNHKADLKFVFQALTAISKVLKDGDLIIIESTIAPRASEDQIVPFLKKLKKKYLLAHCPERAIPGDTLREMVENPRIVGGLTPEASKMVAKLYRSFVKAEVFTTDITTAESCKVMENTFRDVNIALANEFTKISADLGIDVWEAISLANKHPRVNILSPGPGVGGHCIPVDPWFFVGVSKQAKLIKTARDVNDKMPAFVVSEVLRLAKLKRIKKLTVGVLGVSYKKNVDDARETPATQIIKELSSNKIPFRIHDHYVSRFSHPLEPLDEVLAQSNMLLIITDHDEYKTTSFNKYKNIKIILDTRNLLRGRKLSADLHTLGNYKQSL